MSFSKAKRMRIDMQDYCNQRYIGHLLDDEVFDTLNTGDYPAFIHHDGALDAPNFMPAGSMVSISGNYYDRSICERGVSLEDRLRIDEFIRNL